MINLALIIGGLVAIAVSIWGKRFYNADVEGMSYGNEKEVSPMLGKLIFGIVGFGLLIIGILKLLRGE